VADENDSMAAAQYSRAQAGACILRGTMIHFQEGRLS